MFTVFTMTPTYFGTSTERILPLPRYILLHLPALLGFHTAISQLKFTCVLSRYGKWQANKSQHIDNVPHQAKHSNQLSAAIFKHRLFLGVYVLQAV